MTIEIELPDGTILEAPDDADPSAVAKGYLARTAAPAAPASTGAPAAPSPPQTYGQRAMGRVKGAALAIPDALAALGSSSIAGPVAGLAGLATAPFAGADKAADNVRATADALSYSPRTEGGQQLVSGITWPFRKLAEGADIAGGFATDVTRSPAIGAAVNTGIQALPIALGAKMTPKPAARPAPVPTPLQASVKAARDAGFKLTPQQARSGVLGQAAEGLSGAAKIERNLSLKNKPRVEQLIREEIGIPAGQPITKGALELAKKAPNRVYKEASQAGTIPVDTKFTQALQSLDDGSAQGSFAFDRNPKIETLKTEYGKLAQFEAKDAIQQVRILRQRGNARVYGSKYDPENAAIGRAELKLADAIEQQMDRHISAGNSPNVGPDVVPRLKAARAKLAQIDNVRRALKDGDVSATALARQQDRGAPLSGNLKTVADAASQFGRSFQSPNKIRGGTSLDYGDLLAGGLGGIAGYVANPYLALLAGARPGMRGLLGTNTYQRLGIDSAAIPRGPRVSPGYSVTGGYLPLFSEQARSGLLNVPDPLLTQQPR